MIACPITKHPSQVDRRRRPLVAADPRYASAGDTVLSRAAKAAIVAEYERGQKVADIGARHGVCDEVVQRILRAAGVMPVSAVDPREDERILTLRADGLTIAEVSERVGRSPVTVMRRLAAMGRLTGSLLESLTPEQVRTLCDLAGSVHACASLLRCGHSAIYSRMLGHPVLSRREQRPDAAPEVVILGQRLLPGQVWMPRVGRCRDARKITRILGDEAHPVIECQRRRRPRTPSDAGSTTDYFSPHAWAVWRTRTAATLLDTGAL